MTEPHHLQLTIRPAGAADTAECGRICYDAFASIATRHPGFFGVVAEQHGRIVGSNFLDERSTIAGVGPVTVDPEVQNNQVGRALMNVVLQRAAARRVPGVRLLQVAYHNRSMSLYAKLGFDVREPFAAMQGDPLALRIPGCDVRVATEADLPACNALCVRVHCHDRSGELRDAVSSGAARVVDRAGRITGYTTGIAFLGHSVV